MSFGLYVWTDHFRPLRVSSLGLARFDTRRFRVSAQANARGLSRIPATGCLVFQELFGAQGLYGVDLGSALCGEPRSSEGH